MIRLSVIIALVVVTSPAFAFNALGHRVSAEIAWQRLDKETQQNFVDTLRRHPLFDADFAKKMPDNIDTGNKAEQDHWIFLRAATWPDITRRSTFDRPSWHYINLPIYLNSTDYGQVRLTANLLTEYPSRIDRRDYNIIQALQYSYHAIHHPNARTETKALALCWLMHLVGDLHQPMHAVSLYSAEHFPKATKVEI